ncbi:helix-hairpin-helix domain-containing protein [Virgibacillus necropolis]|uniref:Pathogenicity locus n=1 Tax=Virgibacillus necropolis TaxID=163877 RepID=A0A221M877_9BACI|nr:helix-hairpin-helix domain-containing protein [Virgibacillus necropolis]ASN03840.1 Pathogenicity locus [Virgibacillus necropolis]
MKASSPKLPLTPEERSSLRANKIKLNQISEMEPKNLAIGLGASMKRANYLKGLAIFQTIPSIGPKLAQLVVDLGYYSFEDFENETGVELINCAEEQYGYWMDPCVEDSLRCVVYHANHPGSEKKWFDFTAERKEFREQNGYPDTRPKMAWYEVEGASK